MTGDGNEIERSAARAAGRGGAPAAGAGDGVPAATKTTVVGWAPPYTGQTFTNQDPPGLGGAGRAPANGTQRQVDGVEEGAGTDGLVEDDPVPTSEPGPPGIESPGAMEEPVTETLTVLPPSDAVASASAAPAETASTTPITTGTESALLAPCPLRSRLRTSMLLSTRLSTRLPPPLFAATAAR